MILLTGTSGLVGKYLLLELLKKGENVRALIRNENSKKRIIEFFKFYEPENFQSFFDRIQWTYGDILDINSLDEATKDINFVYHVAAIVDFDEKKSKEIIEANIEGTKNIVNISLNNKIQKFCFISSIAALDKTLNQDFIDETSQFDNSTYHSSYAISKHLSEMEVWRASQEGMKVVIVNPGIIIGSFGKNGSYEIFRMANRKNGFCTNGFCGYIDVIDVAKICYILMKDQETFNEKFVLVSENKTYKEIFFYLRNLFNRKKAYVISDKLLNIVYQLNKIFKLSSRLNKYSYEALINKTLYSNKKIKDKFNFNFISIEDSLKHHGSIFLNNIDIND